MFTPKLSIVHINLPDPFFAIAVPLSPSLPDYCQKHSVNIWMNGDLLLSQIQKNFSSYGSQGSRVSKQVSSTPHLSFAGKMPLPVISSGISAPKGEAWALQKRSVG